MARLRNHPARLKLVLSDSAQQPSRATLSVREQPCRAVLSWAEQVGVMDWEGGATKTAQSLGYAERRQMTESGKQSFDFGS